MNVVYLIQAGDTGPVLLGMTDARHVRRRVNRLQEANAELLHVRALLDGDERLERLLHVQWAPVAVRGDWYEPVVLTQIPEDVTHADLGDDLDETRRIAAIELAELDAQQRHKPEGPL